MLSTVNVFEFIRKIERYYDGKDYEVYCFEIREYSISIWIKAKESTERYSIEYDRVINEDGSEEYYCNYMNDLSNEKKQAVSIY